MVAVLTGEHIQVASSYNGHKHIFLLDQNEAANCLYEVDLPDVSDGGRLRLFLTIVADGLVVEPEAHQVTIFEADVAALTGMTHSHTADLSRLLAHQVTRWLELFQVWWKIQPEDFRFLAKGQ